MSIMTELAVHDQYGCIEVSRRTALSTGRISGEYVRRTLREEHRYHGPTHVYLFVLRGLKVKAVELATLADVPSVRGPYLGFRIDKLADAEMETQAGHPGFIRHGDDLGGVTGLFVNDDDAEFLVDTLAGADIVKGRLKA